jgi:hypothetical protein
MWLLGNLSNCVVELTLFLKQPSGFTLTMMMMMMMMGGLQCTYSGATCKAAVTHIHGTHTVRPAGGSPAALPTPNMCVPTGTHSQAMGGDEWQYPQTSSKQLHIQLLLCLG